MCFACVVKVLSTTVDSRIDKVAIVRRFNAAPLVKAC